MRSCVCILALVLAVEWGCAHKRTAVMMPAAPAPYQQFVAQNFDWSSVQRIVVMPLANQTAFPKVTDELQANLAAELQRAGRFDIVVATRDDPGARAQDIFRGGQFDELELLRVAREYQAQAVLFANVTQYHPYAPPRVGMSLLLVSPAEGVAIASAEGLWDARETTTALQAQAFYKQSLNWPQSLMGADRILESPDVYQRFVCQQMASSLSPPLGGAILPAGGLIGTDPLPGFAPVPGVPPLMNDP
jgi:hypothetical protein